VCIIASSIHNAVAEPGDEHGTLSIPSTSKRKYDDLKVKYDTLIPILDGFFLTYHKLDSINFVKYTKRIENSAYYFEWSDEAFGSDAEKWGVIDSLGKVIIPFVCDGVKEISEGRGVFSVYAGSSSLHTSEARYVYSGFTYFFDKNGLSPVAVESFFTIKVENLSDDYKWEDPITQGPAFFLSYEYRIEN
jgi:hypothetical protein